jgi:hypothetical protein
VPSKLLAEIDIMERVVCGTVDAEFSDLSGFLLFSYSLLLCFPCFTLFRLVPFTPDSN